MGRENSEQEKQTDINKDRQTTDSHAGRQSEPDSVTL